MLKHAYYYMWFGNNKNFLKKKKNGKNRKVSYR